MIDDIRNRIQVDLVLIHKFDRFARNRYDSAVYRREIQRAGARLVAVAQPLDDSPESIILEAMLEAMAEYYSANLAREVMKGMRETAYQCRHTGGIPPLGYDVDPATKKYVINEREAEAVRIIFDMYVQRHSYREICSHLNSLGYQTKLGKPFVNTSLYEILRNKKYTGTYIFNRAASKSGGKRNTHKNKGKEDIICIPGGMPTIIQPSMFEEAQKLMDKRRHAPGAAKAKEVYLLTGLVCCGSCDGAMVGNRRRAGRNKTVYATYECNNRKRLKTCNMKSIGKDHLEKFVLEELRRAVFSDKAFPILLKKLNKANEKRRRKNSRELAQVKKKIATTQEEINNIVNAIAKGLYNPSMKRALTDLEEKQATLYASIEDLERRGSIELTEDMIRNYVEKDKQAIFHNDLNACKRAIPNYVERVTVYEDHIDLILKIVDFNGGGGGNRTRVRKGNSKSFYERSAGF